MPVDENAKMDLCCPFREDNEEEGILCFDPWLDEYAKPPEDIIKNWCHGNHLQCPIYLDFQRTWANRLDCSMA